MNIHDLAASANLLASVVGDMQPRDMEHAYVKFRPGPAGHKMIAKWFGWVTDADAEYTGYVTYPMQWVVSWITIGLRVEDLAELELVSI